MKLAAWLLTASIVTLVSSGCISSPSSGSPLDSGAESGVCPSVAACGGTIVPGTYTITSFCDRSTPVSIPADGVCQGSTESGDGELSGTFWFSENITYMIEGTETIRSLLYLPVSCLSKLGVGTCSELGPAIVIDPTYDATATCTGTSTCTCTAVGTKAVLEQGAYFTSDGNLTLLNYSNNENTFFSYCVSGNQISMSSTNNGPILSMVLTRQDEGSGPPDGSVMTDGYGADATGSVQEANSPGGDTRDGGQAPL